NFGNGNFLIKKANGEIKEVTLKINGNKRLGYLLVPRIMPKEDVIEIKKEKFSEIIEKIKKEENKDIK
ncbi:MAG: hypothetical protein ACRC2K_06350, partial [Clostridium sp.]